MLSAELLIKDRLAKLMNTPCRAAASFSDFSAASCISTAAPLHFADTKLTMCRGLPGQAAMRGAHRNDATCIPESGNAAHTKD